MSKKRYYISDYIPHKGQIEFHRAKEKEVVVISAIRSGKSYAVIYDSIVNSWNDNSGFGTLITAPTYRLVDTVLERQIVNRLEYFGLLHSHSFSRHETTLKNGNLIYYRSLEDPDLALRGLNISRAYIDEAAYCSKYAVDVVKGRLLTTNGQLKIISTPAGLNNWLYQDYFSKGQLSGVRYIRFSIYDNPIITAEAVKRLEQSYDPLLFKQEVLGEWVNLFNNQVYYSFSEDNITYYEYDQTQPVYIGLDFNIDKNAWCAIQKLPDNRFVVFYEGYGAKTTADVGRQIIEKFGYQPIIVPDATGNNRIQGVAQTNIQLLRQTGLNRIVENNRNPDRLKRYAIVNATLQNALGQRRLLIDSRCTETIRELRELSFKPGTDRPDDKNNEVGHRTDALGYALTYLTGNKIGQINSPSEDFYSAWRKKYNAYKNY
ncbi:MAG: hypothetical protein KatS3mg036_0491 [Ignavibacterium sp.]|uniref:phage terminase large subunit n=1 Tax=Ignavibacterium sp. TaxID=2651167 RepID=UPI0021DD3ABE|nr:phage terminase large subunit [Ignavibacterium sp.]BDQ01937.1 MAG: hypothetical protein KatS3mg037_0512 [Ignavibacterium sp.]GIV45673.1 MAG: hypothetical protein KatS3mg036_0491 [Ignavibacterium sp.]